MSVSVIAYRLLLVMSLWQGPVPYLDYHDEDPRSARETEHLARFHQGRHAGERGWHLHFVWPWHLDCPADQPFSSSSETSNIRTGLDARDESVREAWVIESALLADQGLSLCDSRPVLTASLNAYRHAFYPADTYGDRHSTGYCVCVSSARWRC